MQKDFIINKNIKEVTKEVNKIKYKSKTYDITPDEAFDMVDAQCRAIRYLIHSGVSVRLKSLGIFEPIKGRDIVKSNDMDVKINMKAK